MWSGLTVASLEELKGVNKKKEDTGPGCPTGERRGVFPVPTKDSLLHSGPSLQETHGSQKDKLTDVCMSLNIEHRIRI